MKINVLFSLFSHFGNPLSNALRMANPLHSNLLRQATGLSWTKGYMQKAQACGIPLSNLDHWA
jgi:hypothetical protein